MNDLARALTGAVADLEAPAMLLISLACRLLSLFAFLQGCVRLLKASEDRYRAPPMAGTVVSFAAAAILAALPEVLAGAGETLFGGQTRARASLGYAAAQAAEYDRLLGALFAIVRIVGLLAFVKGLFVLRAASDGRGGAGVPSAAFHMLGGLALWHVLPVLAALQATLGISVLRIR